MNYRDVKKALELYTYKPGFKIVIEDNAREHRIEVVFRPMVLDSNSDMEEQITISTKQTWHIIPTVSVHFLSMMDFEQFKIADLHEWMQAKILEFERHERDEFLRFNGKRIAEPHNLFEQIHYET